MQKISDEQLVTWEKACQEAAEVVKRAEPHWRGHVALAAANKLFILAMELNGMIKKDDLVLPLVG